jgi:hypothetical protein
MVKIFFSLQVKMSLTLGELLEVVSVVVRDGPRGMRRPSLMPDILQGNKQHTAQTGNWRRNLQTGSVVVKPRCGRPSVSENTRIDVIAKFHTSPRKSIRRTSAEIGVPKSRVHDILKKEKFHPYKLQILRRLTEDDPDRRL